MNSSAEREYTDSYVAFIDIIGFKELVKKESCERIVRLFKEVKNPLSKIYIGSEVSINIAAVKMKVMSDTICFFIPANRRYALYSIMAVCQSFQRELLRQSKPILIYGAISRGDLYQSRDITFGPGFNSAYRLVENKSHNPRIEVDKIILDDIKRRNGSFHNTAFSHYSFPKNMVYTDDDDTVCIDYMEEFCGLDPDDSKTKSLYDYSCEQIQHLEKDKQVKWEYVLNQIQRVNKYWCMKYNHN